MKTKQNYHAKIFDAQIELANKKSQASWEIKQTENGWYVVVRKPYTGPKILNAFGK